MCTALALRHLFGRTLDLEHSYHEQVVVVPRRFPLSFCMVPPLPEHYAMVGMAHISQGFPLLYDAVNEAGLAMAALNFPHSAVYQSARDGMDNLAPFELIAWALGQCATVSQVRQLLKRANITKLDFSSDLPSTPLHWLIADREQSLVAEPMEDGLHLYENPVGVLTNEPPFAFQLSHLTDFLSLSAAPPVHSFSPHLSLAPYSRGMGALGLPGDWSSRSRFVRAAFAAHNSTCPADITQFFHLMSCVEVPRGCVRLEDGQQVTSIYTSCCDLDWGIYHYVTYSNRQICAVDLHRKNLNATGLTAFPLLTDQHLHHQN